MCRMCRRTSQYNRCNNITRCNNNSQNYCPFSNSNGFSNCPYNSYQNINNNSCNTCNNKERTFPDNYLYGYAYTPNQNFDRTFSAEDGLVHGSLFPELVSPYSPGQSMDFIDYLKKSGGQEYDG